MPEFKNEAAILEGAGIVMLADSHLVEEGFSELATAAGAEGVTFTSTETAGLSNLVEAGVDAAQGIALPVAVALLVAAGLRRMMAPFTGARKRARA